MDRKQELAKRKSIFLVLLGILLITLTSATRTKFRCSYEKYPEAKKILEFIPNRISDNARIHIQDSSKHPYFQSHFTAFVPYLTHKETSSGSYPFVFSKFKFSQFIDNRVFGKCFSTRCWGTFLTNIKSSCEKRGRYGL